MPKPYPMSQDHLADVFAERYAGQLAHAAIAHSWRRWYVFDCDVWQEDTKLLHCRLAVELCRGALYWPEAADLTAQERRALGSKAFAWGVLWLARCDPRIAALPEDVGAIPPVRWQRRRTNPAKLDARIRA